MKLLVAGLWRKSQEGPGLSLFSHVWGQPHQKCFAHLVIFTHLSVERLMHHTHHLHVSCPKKCLLTSSLCITIEHNRVNDMWGSSLTGRIALRASPESCLCRLPRQRELGKVNWAECTRCSSLTRTWPIARLRPGPAFDQLLHCPILLNICFPLVCCGHFAACLTLHLIFYTSPGAELRQNSCSGIWLIAESVRSCLAYVVSLML